MDKEGLIKKLNTADLRIKRAKAVMGSKLGKAEQLIQEVKIELEKEEEEEIPPHFHIRGNQPYYLKKPIILCGASEWCTLARIMGIIPDVPAWQNITYDEYVTYLVRFPTNYVRQGIVPNLGLMQRFTEDMRLAGKIVEWTIYNRQAPYDMGDPRKAVNALISFFNVFFDAHNEFMDEEEDVHIAIDLANYVIGLGGTVSAGAWGYSHHGEDNSDLFRQLYDRPRIRSVHEHWTKASIEKENPTENVVLRNEYFDLGEEQPEHAIGFEGFKRIARETFEARAKGCCYYPFIDSWKDMPTHGRRKAEDYLEFMGQLCRELNPQIVSIIMPT